MSNAWKNKMIWVIFAAYVIVSGYTMAHHELWSDEVHSWNIAKASNSYSDLLANRRYEGHPPGWYTILWTISKFTHKVGYMQAAQWAIACAVVFVILFFSPFPLAVRMLIPFGYYFLYEYAVISRNYAIGVLLALCICLIMRKEFKYRSLLYYALLFCLSNVHMLALLLAGSLHLYFLLLIRERNEKKSRFIAHVVAGALVLIPAIYFILPPSDGQLNMHFLMRIWHFQQLTDFATEPLRSFLPIPALWVYHFWNTEFLLEAGKSHPS